MFTRTGSQLTHNNNSQSFISTTQLNVSTLNADTKQQNIAVTTQRMTEFDIATGVGQCAAGGVTAAGTTCDTGVTGATASDATAANLPGRYLTAISPTSFIPRSKHSHRMSATFPLHSTNIPHSPAAYRCSHSPAHSNSMTSLSAASLRSSTTSSSNRFRSTPSPSSGVCVNCVAPSSEASLNCIDPVNQCKLPFKKRRIDTCNN